MRDTQSHLKALEEIECNGLPGLVEVLREEGLDAVRYVLWDATGWHRDWSEPLSPDNLVSQLLQRSDVEFDPDEGEEIEEKPYQGVQASVCPADRNGTEAPGTALPRAQPRTERVLLKWRRQYQARGEAAFTEKQLSESEALEQKVAELERFCGKLALENEILKKGLARSHSKRGTP